MSDQNELILSEIRRLRDISEERDRKNDERYEADKLWKTGHDELHRAELAQINRRLSEVTAENERQAKLISSLKTTADKGDGALRVILWMGGFMVGITGIVGTIWAMMHGKGA